MKAVVYTQYGSPDVLQVTEVAKPVPQANQVLVKIHAVSVNTADWYLLNGKPFLARLSQGLFKPKEPILGVDIAGVVEAVGTGVTRVKPGDAVFADLSDCGRGGFAEYVAADETALALKPPRLSFEEAAAVPMAAVTALQGLRNLGKIQAGQKVLINGASGGVGTFAVQLAKAFGAEVTAVCSARNVDLALSLGADHIIDYTQSDFTTIGQRYDLIIAANGYHPIRHYQRALSPTGRHIVTGGAMAQIFQPMLMGPFLSMGGRQTFTSLVAKPNAHDLAFVGEWLEAGKIKVVIDRCYPLSETAQALRYVGEGHARGKVVVRVV
jgi:NADPH:quinone reductase-like Zn-dependent oxidoreductase